MIHFCNTFDDNNRSISFGFVRFRSVSWKRATGNLVYAKVQLLHVPRHMVYRTSGAGNRHFCDLLARIEDHINVILN